MSLLEYDGWKVGKSVEWLKNNSGSKSQHKCAKFVRLALLAGGIQAYGNPLYAQDYHFKNYLSKLGFKLIKQLNNTSENYIPIVGDIAVMQAPYGEAGHICMWTGEQWVSDFKQKSMRPYKSKGTNPETIYIYRWMS